MGNIELQVFSVPVKEISSTGLMQQIYLWSGFVFKNLKICHNFKIHKIKELIGHCVALCNSL
jgi:hypothetical protein